MYSTTAPLDLDYLNEQLLPRRYESEEEETSESEYGAHDHAFSPIKTAGPFDSDTSADELSNVNSPESPVDKSSFARLLSAYPSGKQSRPVSMDTVKRSSGTTFVPDSYIFDDEDDVIIELPSPSATSPLQSPIFLQPTVYQPPASPPSQQSRSPSPALSESDEETDVLVAEQVKFVEPCAKPNLILISPVTDGSVVEEPEPMSAVSAVSADVPDRFPSGQGIYSLNQGTKSQPLLSDKRPDYLAHMKRGSLQLHGKYAKQAPKRADTDPFTMPRALADVPETAQAMAMRSRAMTWNRPQTRTPAYPGDEFHARSTSVSHSIASSDMSQPPSRTSSPAPYYSSPTFNRHRSGSSYSVSSVPGNIAQRPPLRNSIMKSSTASSVYSASSLRSEVESVHSLEPRETAEPEVAKTARRKKSFRRSKQPKLESTTTEPLPTTPKSFMGFMLRGRRKSTIQKS
ncbi:Beta-ketoacyl synthase, N-terminal domain family protein [Aspergillus niger]|uniref:Beta-ketoacyl synthase, N-terminal domain family protein n=1 Tax=Aspergillus niger TaxID=5061 RepID=A0A505I6Z4_ASPNG|nr:Beta-ketoacyl synthase, N-terminal domain family protein [Aspergillus niger]